MDSFNIGDIVARKSYNFDIMFKVVGIRNEIVDLVGITVRIVADAPIYDLKHIDRTEMKNKKKKIDDSRHVRMSRCYTNISRKYYNMREQINVNDNPNIFKKDEVLKRTGIIRHIDGDADYAEKSKSNYKKMGLTAYVYNIAENEQYRQIYSLLQKIRPNILILTGHDAFLKRRNDIFNIDNYKNSKYYVQGVLEARRYEHNLDNLVVFAGACQSYYEALISAGANFASAPKRVLIDMMDPLIVAETIAYTPVDQYVPLANILSNTREGINGIGGFQTRGQLRTRNARNIKSDYQ